MSELGSVIHPEQYARVGDGCVLSDSIVAKNFFKESVQMEGLVFFGGLYFAATHDEFLPVWLLVNEETGKIVSAAPIFKVKNFDFYDGLQLIRTQVFKHDTFFFWKHRIFASIFTSTGEQIVRKLRCILSANDMLNISALNENIQAEECFPVKLYDQNSGRFLAVCWELDSENSYWYESVCADDDVFLSKIKASETVAFPINIGEKVIIGEDFYFCRYDKTLDVFFEKTPFVATEADREKENIPLASVEQTPKLPHLSIAYSQQDKKKIKRKKKHISQIVALNPEK